MFHSRKLILCAIATAALWGCGDDNDNNVDNGDAGASATAGAAGKAGSPGKAGSSSAGDTGSAGAATAGMAGTIENPGGAAGETGEGGEGGGDTPVSPYPKFPGAIALTGCSNFGPICSVTQNEGALSLQCGTRKFTGTIKENGDYSLTGTPVTSGTTTVTTTNTTCTGKLGAAGVVGTCDNTVSPPPATGSATTTCTMAVNTNPLPGLSCLELPSAFSTFQFDTTDIGSCKLVQNGCNFQADCKDAVITGTANDTGANFNYALKAKANAAAAEGGTPAFLKDAVVTHACVSTLSGDALQGTCSAGAYSARGATPIPATSVYDFEAVASTPVASCSPIGPFTEELFVLDSCTALKNGAGGTPGLGEPICAFQQRGCVWKVTCTTDPAAPLVFTGKLKTGEIKVNWKLSTGIPCEAGFDANGKLAGSCTVPGQTSCELKSKAPTPAVGCAQLGNTFTSRGCGNDSDGIPLKCRKSLQNGCDFAAICDFNATRFPDTIFAGKASTVAGVDYMKFPGLGGRSCSVQKASAAEVADPTQCRAAGEWYGDCLTATGGGCANTFQCVKDANGNYPDPLSNIRRGLRLFF